MEEQWKKCKEAILRFIGGDKKKKLLLFLGIGGMILLLLSEWIPEKSKTDKQEGTKSANTASSTEDASYAQAMEQKLNEAVSSISGAGNCRVLLTLENGTESVYAQNKENEESNEPSKENKKDQAEYIIIKGENGEQALKVKEIEPRVRGVMVICDGGDDPLVRERVTTALTALFDIPSTRVSITKMQSS